VRVASKAAVQRVPSDSTRVVDGVASSDVSQPAERQATIKRMEEILMRFSR
jgi:hypothetical protein